MGQTLIWIESLAVGLLFLGLVTACAAHWPRRWVQRVVPVLAAFSLCASAAGITFPAGALKYHNGVEGVPFFYLLSWTIAFTAGAISVGILGLRRRGEEAAPAACFWSRGKLTLALGTLVILDCITFSNMDLAVKVQLAALRAETGTKILMEKPPRVSDRANAALVYQEAFEAITPREKMPTLWKDKAVDWLDYDKSVFDPKDKDLRKFLDSQGRGLALLRKAAAMPACWFEHDYFLAGDLLLPELQRLRDGAALLACDALSQAAHGEGRVAWEDVRAIFGMSRHINDPILISVLVAIAIEKTGARALEGVLALLPPAPEDLARWPLDESFSYHRSLRRSFQMEEAAFGLSSFAMFATPDSARKLLTAGWMEPLPPPALWLFESPVYRVFLLSSDLATYRRFMKDIQAMAGRPYHEAAKEWQAFDQAGRIHRGGIWTALIVPAVNKCAQAAAEGDAVRHLSQLAIALTAYRAKNGKYPDHLDSLVPEFLPRIPEDPFDGQPIRMKRDGADLVLYSIGRDLKDDGGIPWDAEKQTGDSVFRLRGK